MCVTNLISSGHEVVSKVATKKLESYASVAFRHLRTTDVTEHDTLTERIAWTVIAASMNQNSHLILQNVTSRISTGCL